MTTVVILALATFFVWEAILPALPKLPGLVVSALVYGAAYGLTYVPDQWLIPAAAAGAVGLLHRAIGRKVEPALWPRLSLPRRNPNRPGGPGRRMPGLP